MSAASGAIALGILLNVLYGSLRQHRQDYSFGSILTPRFNDESDVDLSVNMLPEKDPLISGANFLNLYLDLQDIFGRKVDLVSEEYVQNPYFKKTLEETKRLIYE